jgi:hypothetical protein
VIVGRTQPMRCHVVVPMGCADEAERMTKPLAAMESRRGPECLGVRASWPPVVAPVVMDERPAPRCKRRCYRCELSAQPIRTSTVRRRVRVLCDKLICIEWLNASTTRRPARARCRAIARAPIAALYRLSNGIYC